MPGDTIDLKNVPFVSAASSYSFTYGSNGGANDLKITEGGQTYNFNVGTYYDLSGLLTLKPDASGTGTDIVYTSGGASPLQPWGSPLSNFFTTASGPVDGSYWGVSNSDDGGQPIWIETETPASSYVAGQSEPYSIVLTTQDWIGTEQPLLTVATTNLVDPFGSSSQGLGNLAGVGVCLEQRRHRHDGPDLLAGVDDPRRLRCRIPADHDNLRQRPEHRAQHGVDGLAPTQLDAAVSQPLSWNLVNNYTSAPPRLKTCSAIPLKRARRPRTSSCRALRQPASRPQARYWRRSIADGTWYDCQLQLARTEISIIAITRRLALPEPDFTLNLSIRPRARWARPSAYLLTPGFTSVSSEAGVTLSDGDQTPVCRRVPKLSAGHPGLSGNGSPTPAATFDLSGATADRYSITSGHRSERRLDRLHGACLHRQQPGSSGAVQQLRRLRSAPISSFPASRLSTDSTRFMTRPATIIASSSITRSLTPTAARRSRASSTIPRRRAITTR